jgi:RNA recognition motif-containing protein
MKRLYVGNLPFSMTSDDLLRLFGAHGTVVESQVITDKYTGKSRGFGFVAMENDADADAAIAALNGTDQGGRALTVNEAQPRSEGGGGRGGDRGPRRDRGDRGGYGGGRGDRGGRY